jgi:hypothetical protein
MRVVSHRAYARERPDRVTLAALTLLNLGLPPADICLVDFGAMVVLLALSVAAIDPRRFEAPRAAWTLRGVCQSGDDLGGAPARRRGPRGGRRRAARPAPRASGRPPRARLSRPERVPRRGEQRHPPPARLPHTALNGGVTTLFWGKLSHHLPVGYRPGKEPPHPPDWRPWEFTRTDLDAATAVLVEWPDTDDDGPAVLGADPLRDELQKSFSPVECRGRWCLYVASGQNARPDA